MRTAIELTVTPQELMEAAARMLLRQRMSWDEGAAELRRNMILEALRLHRGNLCRAARELGQHRNTLSRAIEELKMGDEVALLKQQARGQGLLRLRRVLAGFRSPRPEARSPLPAFRGWPEHAAAGSTAAG